MNEIDIDKNLTCVNSVFEQPWWLDAVAQGRWQSIEINSGGKTTARLPYVLYKRFGFKIIGMPPNPAFRISIARQMVSTECAGET